VSRGITWREAIAAENKRLGIKASPRPAPITAKKRVGHIEQIEAQRELAEPLGRRSRHVTGEMNGIEKRYAAHLETQRICGAISGWKFEPIKLRLARATFYSPDFMVVMPSGCIELHETKGFMEDDAVVKLKVAAEMFPEFKIVLVKLEGKPKRWSFKTYGKN
jgi:hypothetical protein